MLILDGHSSHYTHALLEYARAHNTVILGYPPHCMHALQGLDAVCFARMKECWKEAISTFESLHKQAVTKGDFTYVFGTAYIEAFTTESITAAFRVTGIHPFNRDVIALSQMKPSLPGNIKASFPLPQTSPVRAVMAAYRAQPPVLSHMQQDNESAIEPISPSPAMQHTEGPHLDPALYTPSKRIHLLDSSLASTSSGSCLIQKARITSAYEIAPPVLEALPELPQPDWSLLSNSPLSTYSSREQVHKLNDKLAESLQWAHDQILAYQLINEGAQAQLIVQDLTLRKLKESLFTKENKQKNDRTKLFPQGKGRVLTDDAFTEEIKRMDDARTAKEKGKEARVASREARKEAQ